MESSEKSKTPEGNLVELDGDYDNGIIAHEYGHGISNRLTAGPNNTGCLGNGEQMGEGWSDFFSLITTVKEGDSGEMGRGIGNVCTTSSRSTEEEFVQDRTLRTLRLMN